MIRKSVYSFFVFWGVMSQEAQAGWEPMTYLQFVEEGRDQKLLQEMGIRQSVACQMKADAMRWHKQSLYLEDTEVLPSESYGKANAILPFLDAHYGVWVVDVRIQLLQWIESPNARPMMRALGRWLQESRRKDSTVPAEKALNLAISFLPQSILNARINITEKAWAKPLCIDPYSSLAMEDYFLYKVPLSQWKEVIKNVTDLVAQSSAPVWETYKDQEAILAFLFEPSTFSMQDRWDFAYKPTSQMVVSIYADTDPYVVLKAALRLKDDEEKILSPLAVSHQWPTLPLAWSMTVQKALLEEPVASNLFLFNHVWKPHEDFLNSMKYNGLAARIGEECFKYPPPDSAAYVNALACIAKFLTDEVGFSASLQHAFLEMIVTWPINDIKELSMISWEGPTGDLEESFVEMVKDARDLSLYRFLNHWNLATRPSVLMALKEMRSYGHSSWLTRLVRHHTQDDVDYVLHHLRVLGISLCSFVNKKKGIHEDLCLVAWDEPSLRSLVQLFPQDNGSLQMDVIMQSLKNDMSFFSALICCGGASHVLPRLHALMSVEAKALYYFLNDTGLSPKYALQDLLGSERILPENIPRIIEIMKPNGWVGGQLTTHFIIDAIATELSS